MRDQHPWIYMKQVKNNKNMLQSCTFQSYWISRKFDSWECQSVFLSLQEWSTVLIMLPNLCWVINNHNVTAIIKFHKINGGNYKTGNNNTSHKEEKYGGVYCRGGQNQNHSSLSFLFFNLLPLWLLHFPSNFIHFLCFSPSFLTVLEDKGKLKKLNKEQEQRKER